tara:strand:+ start:328 stop:543 length:216 start_codon:yes stop_codon:yes gene_type:complete
MNEPTALKDLKPNTWYWYITKVEGDDTLYPFLVLNDTYGLIDGEGVLLKSCGDLIFYEAIIPELIALGEKK